MTQKTYCNTPELLTREARWLLVFDKDALKYNDNYKSKFPSLDEYLFRVSVQETKAFKRSVKSKEKDANRFRQISLSARYFPLNNNDINELIEYEYRNKYVVVLISNENMEVFGNHREPITFSISDSVVDNASGKDCYNLNFTGDTTIVKRVTQSLPDELNRDYFRVLLYGNPIT